MNLRETFAANLRRVRHETGLSQEELADEAEVDRAYVSRVERSVTSVSLDIIEKFTKVLKVQAAELFQPVGRRAKK